VSRKQFLALYASSSLWHFWAASMLRTRSLDSGLVGNAPVTNLGPQESLGRGLAVCGVPSAGWEVPLAVRAPAVPPTALAGHRPCWPAHACPCWPLAYGRCGTAHEDWSGITVTGGRGIAEGRVQLRLNAWACRPRTRWDPGPFRSRIGSSKLQASLEDLKKE